MSITAVLIVYNEEERVEATLKSFKWCDEIVVLDRHSSDRTREIVQKYTSKLFLLPDREAVPQDHKVWLSHATGDWILVITASDLIHPGLARQIKELVENPSFGHDVIHVPYRRFVLGLETPHSPWYSEVLPALARKSVIRIKTDSVHGAISFDTSRHYKMPNSEKFCMYHLTHASVDMMMDRNTMYCRVEGRVYPKDKPLWRAFSHIFLALYRLIFRRRTFLMGWDGIALGTAYLSYWMLSFVYIWEARFSKAPQTYSKIRSEIEKAWADAEPAEKIR